MRDAEALGTTFVQKPLRPGELLAKLQRAAMLAGKAGDVLVGRARRLSCAGGEPYEG